MNKNEVKSISFKTNKRAISEPIRNREQDIYKSNTKILGTKREKHPNPPEIDSSAFKTNNAPNYNSDLYLHPYPKFSDNNISVKTYIVYTNLSDIEILKLYKIFSITRYVIKPKKRGRRKKGLPDVDYNEGIKNGAIISISDYTGLKAGIDIKPNRKKKKKGFKNALSIYMIMDKKPINIKICKNGKIQITGSKNITQAEEIIKHFWDHIKPISNQESLIEKNNSGETNTNTNNTNNISPKPESIIYSPDGEDEVYNTRTIIENGEVIELYNMNETTFKAYFQSVMCNITFKLGFNINKELLDKYITEHTEHKSLWGSSFGYTGVNIKFPNPEIKADNIRLMTIKYRCGKYRLNDEGSNCLIKRRDISLPNFYKLNLCNENRKKNKDKYVTFLVFHSGKVNMSSNDYSSMEDPYNEFISIIKDCRDKIEIKDG